MSGRKAINVGDAKFPTQAALRTHIRTLLYKHPVGAGFDEADSAFLLALLNRHHEADDKIGAGVKRFFTRKHATYHSVGFVFERVDGSIDDFGIDYCIKAHTPEEVAERSYRRAARFAVLSSIRKFRDDALRTNPLCALTGEVLSRGNYHVDHAPPNTFAAIASAYLEHVDLRPIDFDYRCDDLGRCMFADEYHEFYFQIFHDERADLRLLAPRANLSGGSWGV